MDEKNWQEHVDKRMDDRDIEDGKAKSFREEVLLALVGIKASLDAHMQISDIFMEESKQDRASMHRCLDKLPAMELGLNNHLHSHDTFRKYIMYPIVVSIAIAALGIFAKVVLHVF